MATEKTALEQLRERIAVTNTDDHNANGVPNGAEDSDDSSDDDDSGDDADAGQGDNSADDLDASDAVEETEDAIEESEDKEKDLEKEKAEARTKAEKERIQRKIDREVAKRKILEEKVASLEAQLEAKNAEDGDKLTKADAEALAKQIAEQTTNEKEFVDTCNKIADAGEKIVGADGKPIGKAFITQMNEMAADIGPIPPDIIFVLGELDNGANVLHYLSNDENIEEAEKIYQMPTARKAIALTKIANKLAAPKPKAISKVPAPNTPIGAGARGNKQLTDKMTDAEWMEARNAQLAARRAGR